MGMDINNHRMFAGSELHQIRRMSELQGRQFLTTSEHIIPQLLRRNLKFFAMFLTPTLVIFHAFDCKMLGQSFVHHKFAVWKSVKKHRTVFELFIQYMKYVLVLIYCDTRTIVTLSYTFLRSYCTCIVSYFWQDLQCTHHNILHDLLRTDNIQCADLPLLDHR